MDGAGGGVGIRNIVINVRDSDVGIRDNSYMCIHLKFSLEA